MTKVDRMSMAHSIEAREPLLDHKLVEFAMRLPMEFRIRNGSGKYLLKRVAERYLPKAIIYRKKQGFGVPLAYWFKGDLRDYVRSVLFDHQAKQRGFLISMGSRISWRGTSQVVPSMRTPFGCC